MRFLNDSVPIKLLVRKTSNRGSKTSGSIIFKIKLLRNTNRICFKILGYGRCSLVCKSKKTVVTSTAACTFLMMLRQG